ncbi:Hypp2791 [Branchiostoma lanceolatum]|uniref:Hypp2791 protein n=1 Tax=Branchiostoma lanceolatum TaxID=7740 RepID=A0A8J9ZZ89_BRALA|nr:Hypp2791 [Branchiostoma lanceolatum]
MEEALRNKDAEIGEMKHELNAAKQSQQKESERASETGHELRRVEEERDREAEVAFNNISCLNQKVTALQTKLSTRDECLERMRNDKKQTKETLQRKEMELHDLKAALKKAEAGRDTLQTENYCLKTDRDALKAERDSLSNERNYFHQMGRSDGAVSLAISDSAASKKGVMKDNSYQRMEEALRDKDAEIAQMNHELNAAKQSQQRESERASETGHALRRVGEERDREANVAFNDISCLNRKVTVLQTELSTRDECLERMRNDKKQTKETLQRKEMELHDLKAALKKAEDGRDTLQTENYCLKTDRNALKAERDSLKTERNYLQTENHSLTTDRNALKAEIGSLKTERNYLQIKIDSLSTERDSLHQQYTEVRECAESLQRRLSNEFCIRLASDETNMENISVKHRPAKIAEKFAQIESKEWVEAKEVLDDKSGNERTNIQILLNMLEFACKRAQEVFDGFLSSEACRLYSPVAATTDILLREQNQNSGGYPKVPGSILKEITAFLKGTCGECDIESLTQSVVGKMKEVYGEDIVSILQDTHVMSFVQACCRLAWQMAVQQPPLTVLTCNTHYDDRCHQLWWNSPSPSRSKGVSRGEIDFYIWPELRQSGNVLQKGRVCLKVKPRNFVCSVTP